MRDPETGQFVSPKDQPKYNITVWDLFSEGGHVLWCPDATDRDLDEIEHSYGDDPRYEIEVERHD